MCATVCEILNRLLPGNCRKIRTEAFLPGAENGGDWVKRSHSVRIKYLFLLLVSALFWGTGPFLIPLCVKAEEPLVIVIDPGHGGENLGARYEGYVEKEMTMAVARAMQDELRKYDGVEVHLTHDTDQPLPGRLGRIFSSACTLIPRKDTTTLGRRYGFPPRAGITHRGILLPRSKCRLWKGWGCIPGASRPDSTTGTRIITAF